MIWSWRISTNFGTASEDLLNRSLPIHLNPKGDIQNRHPSIGNPKLEFLPANKGKIAAELRGMVERWKAAGKPLDEEVRHPFSVWAKVVGGILKVNGHRDFLGNYGKRKTADDPLRHGLGLLGAAKPDEWLRPDEWARSVVDLGLITKVIPDADRENDKSRTRGIGVVMSAHTNETFLVPTDDSTLILRLEKRRHRVDGGDPKVQYRFAVVGTEAVSED